MQVKAKEVVGPYEHWGFGAGAAYEQARARGERDRFAAVLAEVESATDVTECPPRIETGGRLLPMVAWRPGGSGQRPTALPMLADRQDRVERTTHAAHEGEPIRFRRSARIVASTVNASFDAQAIARRWSGGARRGEHKALLAVIDDGIPLAHRNFSDATGRSRIEFCWLQGARSPGSPELETVPFGRELTGEDIDRLKSLHGDEDGLYRDLASMEEGLSGAPSIARRGSHGAHVLDAAAGHRHGSRLRDRPVGRDGHIDEVGIVAVQLPAASLVDTAGFGKDALILAALHYIFERADRMSAAREDGGGHLPLVINFSFGFTGGPRGGRDRLERAVKDLVARRRELGAITELVMPAGNSFHGALLGEVPAGSPDAGASADTFDFRWRLQPNDHTPNFLEIWLPIGATFAGMSLSLIDPFGRTFHAQALADPGDTPIHSAVRASADGTQVGQVSVERYDTGSVVGQARIVVVLAPTEPDTPSLPAAAHGAWTVSLGGIAGMARLGPVICRIQRDEAPFAYIQGARQSYFDDPRDRPYEPSGEPALRENPAGAFVRRFGTLNGLATHDAVLVVAGFRADTGLPAPYSAAGASAGGPESPGNVHVSASSDASAATPGVLAAGTRSGSVQRLDGTSVAAPQVARALALALCRRSGVAVPGPVDSMARELLVGQVVDPEEVGIVDRVGRVAHVGARLGDGMLLSSIAFPVDRRSLPST